MTNAKIVPPWNSNIDTIIFDLGGVLLNLNFQRSMDAFYSLGFKHIREEMAKIQVNYPAGDDQTIFHLFEKGKISAVEFRDGLRRYAGINIGDVELDDAWNSMLMDFHPVNMEILVKLSEKYRLLLLSNTNEIHFNYFSNLLRKENIGGLEKYFDKVYYSHELGMRKPDTDIFYHLIGDAGIEPERGLFIDDFVRNVEAARLTGLNAVHLKHPDDLEKIDFNQSNHRSL